MTRQSTPDVLLFGTFDPESPRTRVLCAAMELLGWQVRAIREDLWDDSAAKVAAWRGRSLWRTVIRGVPVYLRLFFGALRRPPRSLFLLSNGGHLDMLAGWLPAKLSGALLVFDPLYGLHETIVEDRGLASPRSPVAILATALDWLALHLADLVLVDTESHADYFADRYGIARDRMLVVPVGAEESFFHAGSEAAPGERSSRTVDVLFYGTMIPLHGADVIVRAAALIDSADIQITMIGSGQTSEEVARLAAELECENITLAASIPYAQLPERIGAADICLGIFGTTRKAAMVVPTKVYQCLGVGKPIITADTPAIRQVLRPGDDVVTVSPGDPAALASAIESLAGDAVLRGRLAQRARTRFEESFSPRAIADILRMLEERMR